jgi:hypothetical protein
VAGDGLYGPEVAAGESVGPGEAGAVEDVAALAGEELADAQRLIAFRLPVCVRWASASVSIVKRL